MRDLLLTLVIAGSLPAILWRPWIGILVWSWLAYMSPHRLTYGFAFDFNFSMLVGAVTILAFLLKGEKRLPKSPVLWGLVGFTLFTCLTTFFALDPELAAWKWERFIKIQVMTVLTIFLVIDRRRLTALVWVIALSLGFYGLKGGTWGLLDSGENRVWGPPGSFIEDNNHLALALSMSLPLIYFLRAQAETRWMRNGLLGLIGVTTVAILATYSRGGLLALLAFAGYFFLVSRHKARIALATVTFGVALSLFLPEKWHGRMTSLLEIFAQSKKGGEISEVDESADARLRAWGFSIDIANARPIGGGFLVHESAKAYELYYPDADKIRSAHSVYFEVLGEHGWPGFLLYMAVWALTWAQCRRVRRLARARADLRWLDELNAMLQVSFVSFAVGGAFLNLSTFDLFWHLVAISIVSWSIARQAAEAEPVAGSPAQPVSVPARPPALAGAPGAGGLSGFLKKS
jgi:probable O-glycosylation ligase (exosortase A-associated)